MRAAVVTDFHSPLQMQDLPIPEPGARRRAFFTRGDRAGQLAVTAAA